MHLEVKDGIIECLNASYNALAQDHHKLKLEIAQLNIEIENLKEEN